MIPIVEPPSRKPLLCLQYIALFLFVRQLVGVLLEEFAQEVGTVFVDEYTPV
jgi:hypothetical protein